MGDPMSSKSRKISEGKMPDPMPDISGLVVTLYPGGLIGLREGTHCKEYIIPLSIVMMLAIRRDHEGVAWSYDK